MACVHFTLLECAVPTRVSHIDQTPEFLNFSLTNEYWSQKHPQASKSCCWGSYHNKLAMGHFFGTPCIKLSGKREIKIQAFDQWDSWDTLVGTAHTNSVTWTHAMSCYVLKWLHGKLARFAQNIIGFKNKILTVFFVCLRPIPCFSCFVGVCPRPYLKVLVLSCPTLPLSQLYCREEII